MITTIKQFKESVHWKPSNLKAREQLLIDNWQKILSQEVIEGDLILDQWALKVDPNKIKVRTILGKLVCAELYLNSLPEWFSRLHIEVSFKCNDNMLINLKNIPKSMYSFNCSWNRLTSLEGCPEELSMFDCSGNDFNDLKGGPKTVLNNYYCTHNKLTSLKGLANNIGNLNISASKTTFNEGDIPKNVKIEGRIYF